MVFSQLQLNVDFMHNIDLNLSLFSESNYANIIDMVLYEMDSSKEEYRKYINKQGDKMKEFSFNWYHSIL